MIIKTIVAVAFFVLCAVVMGKEFRILDECVPTSQEAEAIARVRRWKGSVAAVVVGAWLCAACIAFGFHMSKVLCVVVFAGPAAITVPVLVWALLVY